MEIPLEQIKNEVMKVAKERNHHVITTTSESEIRSIIQELAEDPKKLNTFMKACFALGFMCHEIKDTAADNEEMLASDAQEHFVQAMIGSSYLIQTVRFAKSIHTKN